MRELVGVVAACSVAALSGCCCNCDGDGDADTVTAATAAQQAALLDRVKALSGTWEMVDEKGVTQTASVFTVTSNGSAVREVMFPGTQSEMTNMYTMDGADLVVTHYCAVGNQPHMRAKAGERGGQADRIALKFDGVSNRTALDQLYMGEMTLVFVDVDHIRQEWRAFTGNGALSDHSPAFELTRKR